MRSLALALIRFYQRNISPLKPQSCRFVPTCSEYAIQSISRFGVLKGVFLTVIRLAKCGPWHPGGVDEVPQPK